MNARRNSLLETTAAALLATLSSSPAAFADPGADLAATEVIRTIDARGVDVASAAGAERLYREIVTTANRICRGKSRHYVGVARGRYEDRHVRPCIEQAVAGALAQVAQESGVDLEQTAGLRGSEEGLRASR